MVKLAEQVIDVAKAEIGYLEKKTNSQLDNKTANAGYNNWNKYARDLDAIPDFFNGLKNGFYWCAIFVCWCFMKAFGADGAMQMLYLPKKSAGASCTYLAGRFKAKRRLFTTPKAGDLAFFTSDNGATYYHMGIVTKVDDTYLYTVEGNTSGGSGVNPNGGGVFEKKYKKTNTSIRYGRPDYDAETTTPAPTAPQTPTVVLPKYTPGKIYKLQVDMLSVRADAGTQAKRKTYDQLTTNAKANAYNTGHLKKGTAVTCLETKALENDVWMRIPSGWIAAYYNGKYYIK